MIMSKKNFLVLFIFTVFLVLHSCGGSENPTKDEPQKELTPPADEVYAGIVNRSLYDEPETKDFEKYNFRILESPNSNVFSFHKQVPEEDIGEVVNDAFIKRNRAVEDRYNIAISAVYNENPGDILQRNIAADDDICDLAFINSSRIFGLAQIGGLVDFNSVKALRTGMPWWDQRIIEGLSVYDKVYTLTGDITTNDDVSALTILYNKELYKNLGYENPYEIVSKGAWTMDKMAEMIKGVNRDLNGDGIIDENDQWGMVSESIAMYYFFFGSGMHYIDKTPGGYEFTLDDAKVRSVIEKTYDLLTADDSIYDLYKAIRGQTDNVYKTLEKMFREDRLLFNVRLVGDAMYLRDMASSFGFLPFPKYDEQQKEYYSWVTMYMDTLVMPSIVPDAQKSGLITEALAFESMFTVREPFYETLLNMKIARDDEDTQMLDLILSSKAYDLDGVNQSSGIQSGIMDMMSGMLSQRNFTLASSWEKLKDKAAGKLEKFLQSFE